MPKHNSKHDTPSNDRYKAQDRLRTNKVRRIAKNQKVDPKTAEAMWEKSKKS